MQVEGSYTFPAPRDVVWRTLLDPNVIAQCMPGGEAFTEIEPDRYEARMKIGIGPIRGTYTGKIFLHDQVEPESYVMDVEGGGGPGHMRGSGRMRLAERGAETVVSYEGEAQVTGKVASVGQRLLGVTAKQLINQFFKCMERKLEAGAADAASR